MTAQAPADGLIAGKYRLVRLLGRGGMGSVWEARHETLGSRVAIKFIEGELLDNPEARARFETEARAAAKIDSKHAIRVDDYGVTEDGKPYIIMEVLEGEDLEKRLQRLGRLTLQDTARIVEQVCRALEKAHGLGIVHRDLKPENIYLSRRLDDHEEVAKVLDFGIAKMASGPARAKTKTGSVFGTLMYMSPEQLHGVDVDYRTDLWAMGVIAFRCVTGTLPFSGINETAIILSILSGPIPVPSQLAPDSPPAFDTWFARAVARDPTRRFGSARDLAASLSMLAGNSAGNRASVPSSGELQTHPVNGYAGTIATPGVAHTGPGLAAPPRSPQRSNGALIGALAGVVVLIGLAAGFATYSRVSGDHSEPAAAATRPANAAPASASATARAPSTRQAPSEQPHLAQLCPTGMLLVRADGRHDAFCVDEQEVTVQSYQECVRERSCNPAGRTVHWRHSNIVDVGDDESNAPKLDEECNARSGVTETPMNCVDSRAALYYCQVSSKRLPTDDELRRSGLLSALPFGSIRDEWVGPTSEHQAWAEGLDRQTFDKFPQSLQADDRRDIAIGFRCASTPL